MKKDYIFPRTETVYVENAQVICASLPGSSDPDVNFEGEDGSEEDDDLAKSRMEAAEAYGATYGDLW